MKYLLLFFIITSSYASDMSKYKWCCLMMTTDERRDFICQNEDRCVQHTVILDTGLSKERKMSQYFCNQIGKLKSCAEEGEMK